LDDKKVGLFGIDSLKNLQAENQELEPAPLLENKTSNQDNQVSENRPNQDIKDEILKTKFEGFGNSHDLKISDNMSFTPYESSENSEKEFNKCIFDNQVQKKIKAENVRKRYSNQGMAFQR
jgi:hypothetical protein